MSEREFDYDKWGRLIHYDHPDGMPRVVVDWSIVRKLAAMHCTRTEIEAFLNVSVKVLRKRAEEEWGRSLTELLQEWRLAGKCSLRRKQWLLADKSAAMAMFLGKQYLDQVDNYGVHQSGSVNQTIVHYGDKTPKKWVDQSMKEELDSSDEEDKLDEYEPT